MPELPEVQTIAADLDEAVRGLTIVEVAIAYAKVAVGGPERFQRLLAGTRIDEVRRLGKWVQFLLTGAEGPVHLLAHLKMTGQFQLGPWPGRGPWPKHIHVAFRLAGRPPEAEALLYRDIRKFGRLRAFSRTEFTAFQAELGQGPDPLTVTPEEFHRRLTARRGRLKTVLLNQTTVAGFGNIYVDESLFAARLSPLTSAAALKREETDRLLTEARRIFTAAIMARGSTTSNYQGLKGGGSYQASHQVYGRSGRSCPVCGLTIRRLLVGGRSTHVCPACQGVAVILK
ncbi:MAG: bifunctional DNA-formamidopyrimidine glycosylase/DNA-(apurinic or apyrimidinic site) lyase [Candidatus Adiutrix sp.]|jgi:formamidopyrimidine-DNA glycosylase|nr:bifunctional DNA-formamidopyrimidine glycosylase/DNA-(apurinic or apyrimidinic site) lyase [Candidatus Adiutrix sp.]